MLVAEGAFCSMVTASAERTPAAKAALLSVVIATTGVSLVTTAPLIAGLSGACLVFVILLLWRGDEPPILFLPALFQWSVVAIWPLSTLWNPVPLNELSSFGADLESSTLYALAGIMALAIGLRAGSRRSNNSHFAWHLRHDALSWRFSEVLPVALGAVGLGYALAAVSAVAGPARELFHQASGLKYVGLFAIAYWCLLRGTQYRILGAIIAFELIIGMTGFFADFKNSVLAVFTAALAARPRFRPKDIIVVSFAAGLILCIAIFWSAVKSDYRSQLNKGSGEQIVQISMKDRLNYLARAAGSFDAAKAAEGFDSLVRRHGYVEFLGLTLQNVPLAVPHENGQLTLNVISHIAMPRFLFPDKPHVPNDTDILLKYTGLAMDADQKTSISIGYLGELYIDFGYIGGLIATAAIGFVVGFLFRILRNSMMCPALFAAGFCVMLALQLAEFGNAYIKLMGSIVFSGAIAIVTQRYLAPFILSKLRLNKGGQGRSMQRSAQQRPPF